jgi:hypothetical protein
MRRALPRCAHCGAPFTVCKPWQRYCSPKCRIAGFRAAVSAAAQAQASADPTPDEVATSSCNAWDGAKPGPVAEPHGQPRPASHAMPQPGCRSAISGPAQVIAIEVMAGWTWVEVMSPDGVSAWEART